MSFNAFSSRGPGTPLPRKLGIRAGDRIALLRAPEGFDQTLGELPAEVSVSRAELERGIGPWRTALAPAGGLWIAWPKQSSGVETDLSDGVVRAAGLAAGLVDNKVCAIDATWSGLRFVFRLADRPGLGEPRANRSMH